MTNEQFLTTFQTHLNVGGPERDEIIAEMKSHLEEEMAEKLGDPKQLAEKSNRVHLGLFSSMRKLLWLRLGTFLIFEIGWTWLSIETYAGSVSRQAAWIYVMNIIALLIPVVVFMYGSYSIGHMRRRWLNIGIWASTFAISGVIVSVLQQALGYLIVASTNNRPIWNEYISQTASLFIVYGTVALGIMIATEGKNMLWPKHQILATTTTFLIIGIASYFALPLTWNAITNFHNSESMATFGEWLFRNQQYLALVLALGGAGVEWGRHQGIKQGAILS